MKIQINRELKIKLLGALRVGVLDTGVIPELHRATIEGLDPFVITAFREGRITQAEVTELITMINSGTDPFYVMRKLNGIDTTEDEQKSIEEKKAELKGLLKQIEID